MLTEFQTQVYDLIQTIPKGKVSSYKAVAQALNCGSAQAIGQALRKNPFAPEVPCHRVVKHDGSLGGFKGKANPKHLMAKIKLLKAEGIVFEDGVIADCYFHRF